MAKSKKTSADMASLASRIMAMAGKGGVIEANRAALRFALRHCDRDPTVLTSNEEAENETADLLLAAIESVLQPYFDAAESLAASVMSQRGGE